MLVSFFGMHKSSILRFLKENVFLTDDIYGDLPDIHCRLHLKFSFSFSNDQKQLFCRIIFQLCLICDIVILIRKANKNVNQVDPVYTH